MKEIAIKDKIQYIEHHEKSRILIILVYFSSLILFGLTAGYKEDIIHGILKIIYSPDTLITDYVALAGYGAAFINSGLVGIFALIIIYRQKIILTGPTIAAIFTMTGFGLFGKNIFNIWPVIVGVWLYSKIKGNAFRNNTLIALFGTALSPIVSEVAFGLYLDYRISIILGIMAGILSGFILPPLSRYFVSIHQGYNLYNVGFTAGFIGMVFMSLLNAFGMSVRGEIYWKQGQDTCLLLFILLFFISMIVIGWLASPSPMMNLGRVAKKSGRTVTDFVVMYGFGTSFLNMGLMGIMGVVYIFLVSGDLNGPTTGAILTMCGFGAFGLHPKNAWPVMLGVLIISRLSIWPVNDYGPLLAALFGTTLAPVAGGFGWFPGIIAGMLHLVLVMNIGYLHGGLNLYNNGFSGGIVATIMLPILESIREEK